MATRAKARQTDSNAESGYDRLAVTMPRRLSRRLREMAESGEIPSISSFVAQAVEEKLGEDDLKAMLAEILEESGPPTPEEQAWADDILNLFRKP